MPRTNPLISTSAIPIETRVQAERRFLNRTMYGINDIIRVDVEGENIVYRLNTTGKTFATAKEAFDEAGKSGMTTFGRLTGNLETSSYNTRGYGGLEERLKIIQETLSGDAALSTRLGVEDPNLIRFEVASYKSAQGSKQALKNIVDQIGENLGVIVPDDDSFNLLRVFSGDRELTVGEISRIFSATSEGLGGILSTDSLMKGLTDGPSAIASLYSKTGKRVRGAIGLRDISLAGEDLGSILQEVSGTSRLDDKSVRIFKVAEDLTQMAEAYIGSVGTTFRGNVNAARLYAEQAFGETVEGLEKTAFYNKSGAIDQVIASLKNVGVLDDDGNVLKQLGSLTKIEKEILEDKFKAGFDGTSVINAKTFNAIRAQVKNELETLKALPSDQRSQQFVISRISELTSQLDKLEGDSFQAITARIFMNVKEGDSVFARMVKAVVDQSPFEGVLDKYSILTTDVAMKKETSIMGTADSINLVLQGEPSARVYADPLAPAFHYNLLSDPDYIRANELRQNRIITSLNHAIETGEIRANLRRQIYQSAEKDLDLLPEASRSSAERNRMFMRQLKEAIESGMDVRTMPQLLNYLKKNAAADLFKMKDGVGYLPALEDTFRLAIDTEASFFGGRARKAARLGEGLTDISILGREGTMKALTFQVQGHKMLFAGDAASMFKHSLGGFDLDDKGIVMPRIFQDASGKSRLGTFMFRQPTGPGEFIFGKADLRNIDTIKLFLENNDALMDQLDELKSLGSRDEVIGLRSGRSSILDLMHEGITATGRRKLEIDRELSRVSSDEIEQIVLRTMERAEATGAYRMQMVDMNHSFFQQLAGKDIAAPLALDRNRIRQLAEAGVAEEKYLVQQYNYGQFTRAFATEGSFDFSQEIHEGLARYTNEEQYQTLNRLRQISKTADIDAAADARVQYSRAVASLMQSGNAETKAGITALFDEDLARKGRSAVLKNDTIGQYINRLTVAAAGADQQEAILSRLQGKVNDSVLSSLRNTRIATFAPSDVVDVIANLNEGIGIESVQSLEALYGTANDKEAAARAIAKITGIQGDFNVSAVEAAGRQMVDTKFELLGKLRSLAMQNLLEEGDYSDLLAGVDNAILNERLKGDDVANALKAYQRGFEDTSVRGANISEAMSEHSQAIKDAFTSGDARGIKESVKALIGLDADSRYAHASKTLRLGQQAKDAMDAVDDAIFRLNRVAYSGEITNSRESMTLATNILDEAQSIMQANSISMREAFEAGEDAASEFFKYQSPKIRAEVVDKVRSMIYEAAGGSEGTTVRQLLDAMETQMSGRYKGVRSLLTTQPGYLDENTLLNMFRARQQERASSFLGRQEGISALTDQYDEMVQAMKTMSVEERREILAISEDMIGKSRRGTALVDEDQFRIAAALLVGQEKQIGDLGLDDATEKAVRQMRMLQQARSTVTELGMDEILSFGGRTSASNFVPDMVDLTDEERSNLFRGLDGSVAGETERAAGSAYKRIGKEFFDKPIIKKSGYALAGLVAASFIYSASKNKDVTQSDVAGPPLLPGGSAYDNLPQRQSQVPEGSIFSGYDEGVGYTVNIEGSRDQAEAFSNSIGSVARGPVNSTMYRGLPQLGKDPYSQIASSY